MEVDGKEFMRNVGLEQDKERLMKEQQKLESLKRESVIRDENYANEETLNTNKDESAYVDLSIDKNVPPQNDNHSIEDLMLEPEDPNLNKKRYIVLGVGLILLFIITVLVIRVISNNDTKEKMENLNPQTSGLVTDKILNKIDSNEEYQKVIDKKIALDESNKIEEKRKSELNEIVTPNEPTNTPLVIDKPKPKEQPKRDPFGLDSTTKTLEKPVETKKPVVKATPPKPKPVEPKVLPQPKKKVVVAPAAEKNLTQKMTTITGYYIQIGAFTKQPSKALLNSIGRKGYSYKVHPMVIKGKLYNKVLIGGFKSRKAAAEMLSKVKKDFNNPNAYILKF